MSGTYSIFPLRLVVAAYFDITNSRNAFRVFVTITASVTIAARGYFDSLLYP